MPTTRGGRISALLCLMLAVSAWLPIPLPTEAILARLELPELDRDTVGVEVDDARLRWGPGRVVLTGLRVTHRGREIVRAERVELAIGLLPGSRDFLQPRGAILTRPVVQADEKLVRMLDTGDESEAAPPPKLPILIEDGRVVWRDTRGFDLTFRSLDARARLDRDGLRLNGTVLAPYGLTCHAWLSADEDFSRWVVDVECESAALRETGIDPVATVLRENGIPLDWSGDRCSLHARLTVGDGRPQGQLDLAADGFVVRTEEPRAELRLSRFRARGDVESGLRIETDCEIESMRLRAESWLRRDADGVWQIDSLGQLDPIELTPALADRLRRFDDSIGEVLDALEPRGELAPRVRFQWRQDEPPRLAVAAPVPALQITYRGFPESDGDKPSFPYPITGLRGDLAFANQELFVDGEGDLGDGTIEVWATVEIGRGKAGVTGDLAVRDVAVDSRVTRAVSGTPDIAKLWRDLGGPNGGHANVDLRLRRRPGEDKVGISIEGDVHGTAIRLSMLPIPVVVDQLALHWKPGVARFDGTVAALGTLLTISGGVDPVAGAEAPALRFHGHGTELLPSDEERLLLERYLKLPEGISHFPVSGDATLRAAYRHPGDGDAATVFVDWSSSGSALTWQTTGLAFDSVDGRAVVARAADGLLALHSPRIDLETCGGNVVTSTVLLAKEGEPPSGETVVACAGVELTEEARASANRLLRLTEGPSRYDLQGTVDLVARLDPAEPTRHRGRVGLRPVTVGLREEWPLEDLTVDGDLLFVDGQVTGGEVLMANSAGELKVAELRIEPLEGGDWMLEALLDSPEGIEMRGGFAALVSTDAWAAIERIGLAGRVGAERLQLQARIGEESAGFSLDGDILLRAMRVEGPPRMRGGSGRLTVDGFHWNGREDFRGSMGLRDGQVRVSGLAVHDARGSVQVSPRAVVLRDFVADTLGGEVRTIPKGDAEAVEGEEPRDGHIRFGLQREAPVDVLLYLEGLSLAQVREELALGGNLAGSIRGMIDFRSTSPSPLDYSGRGWVEIEEGRLGSVPVLAQMWKVADIRPPVFTSGRVEWSSNAKGSRGRVRVEKFELDHPLLQVQGSGWVGLDSYLDMKATVRTLLFLTDLPIIRDLVDLLIEQNVQGPFDRPVISQRVLSKYGEALGGELGRYRFPLWLPAPEATPWQRSPVFPVTERPEGPQD